MALDCRSSARIILRAISMPTSWCMNRISCHGARRVRRPYGARADGERREVPHHRAHPRRCRRRSVRQSGAALKFPYPGGPHIDGLRRKRRKRFALPRAWLEADSYDFSFSGLKSAVLAASISRDEGRDAPMKRRWPAASRHRSSRCCDKGAPRRAGISARSSCCFAAELRRTAACGQPDRALRGRGIPLLIPPLAAMHR